MQLLPHRMQKNSKVDKIKKQRNILLFLLLLQLDCTWVFLFNCKDILNLYIHSLEHFSRYLSISCNAFIACYLCLGATLPFQSHTQFPDWPTWRSANGPYFLVMFTILMLVSVNFFSHLHQISVIYILSYWFGHVNIQTKRWRKRNREVYSEYNWQGGDINLWLIEKSIGGTCYVIMISFWYIKIKKLKWKDKKNNINHFIIFLLVRKVSISLISHK